MKKSWMKLECGAWLTAVSLAVAISSASAAPLSKTTTDISSSANPSAYGQWVTLTATVTAASGTPTGTVTFKSGNTILAIATLNKSGQAMFTTNVFLGKGSSSHPISADYSGDNNFKSSSANGFKQGIVPATVTVAGITANNKAYDATTNAIVDTGSAALVGVVAGDVVTLDASSVKGAFANKNAGKNKTVSLSGLALSGADSANYILVVPSDTADIVPATVTVSGITAENKIYNATPGATVDTSSAALVGVTTGDAVTLDVSGAQGVFADKNAGTNKTVNISGIALSGADSANYKLALPNAAANIVPATLTVTADNQSRTYGTNNPALTASYSGFVNGETLATSDVTGSPSLTTTATTNSAAGSYPIVAAAGTLASVNYNFAFVNGTLQVTGSDKTPVQNISMALSKSASGMKVNLSGMASQTYVIEASTDLVHWTAISTNSTDSNGLSTFIDSDSKNYSSRFYRGVATAQ
jgi:hypothetical protein